MTADSKAMPTGQRVKLARIERGLTQAQLSALSGVVQPDISKIERGGNAHLRTIERLFAAMQLPPPGSSNGNGHAHVGEAPQRTGHGALTLVDLDGEIRDTQWIADGFLARGAVTMVAGAPGAGKSMLSQQLASVVASWCRVCIIDAENGDNLIRSRFRKMGMTPTASRRVAVHEAHGFDLVADRPALETVLRQTGARVLILDSFASLWNGSENHTEGVKHVLNELRAVAKANDVAILLIHHTTKGSDTYRGSGAIAGTIEAVFTFTRIKGAPMHEPGRVLTCVKQRLAPEPEPIYVEFSNGGFEGVRTAKVEDNYEDPNADE